ncbi:hypothetical protein PoB_007613700 [Plakobranchus ocellatus]|uniref:Uncharacterized protein n=1 Tax=Plakobranchus ocellatus TaxID=259542 RepID=A0AAV4DZ80_9GAST|nr:hypothetical protein PoB_007613700 [Plakobranchus ocellatus]
MISANKKRGGGAKQSMSVTARAGQESKPIATAESIRKSALKYGRNRKRGRRKVGQHDETRVAQASSKRRLCRNFARFRTPNDINRNRVQDSPPPHQLTPKIARTSVFNLYTFCTMRTFTAL